MFILSGFLRLIFVFPRLKKTSVCRSIDTLGSQKRIVSQRGGLLHLRTAKKIAITGTKSQFGREAGAARQREGRPRDKFTMGRCEIDEHECRLLYERD